MAGKLQGRIKNGDRVTIRQHNGLRLVGGKVVQDFKEATGKAVMHSADGGWVLNMGGRFGTPAVANDDNIVAIRGKRVNE